MSDANSKKRKGRPKSASTVLDNPLALQLVKEMLQRDATMPEIATSLRISLRTLERWKEAHPEFWRDASAKIKLDDDAVERALFESATGFTRIVTKIDENGKMTHEQRYFPPNVAASTFYLKNRRSEKWRDKIDIAASMEQIPVRINLTKKEKVIDAQSTLVGERKELPNVHEHQSGNGADDVVPNQDDNCGEEN